MSDPLIDEQDEDEWDFGFDLVAFARMSPQARAEAERMAHAMRTPLAPGDPRRHHYIPRWFLHRFADSGSIVRVPLDDPTDRQSAAVGTVAFLRDFYTTIDVEVGPTVAVERLLAHIDGEAAAAVDRLSHGVLFPPTPADRIAISTWLAMMFVRTPARRRQIEALADHAYKLELSMVVDEAAARAYLRRNGHPDATGEQVAELLANLDHLDDVEITPHQNTLVRMMLQTGLTLVPGFLNRQWLVARFAEDGLVLPDQPLTLYTRNPHPMMGVGVGTADEIIMPIDRRTALVMHTEGSIGDLFTNMSADRTVDQFNQHVVGSATREVFCHPDDVGRLDVIELPEANRPLWQVSGADWVPASTDGVNTSPTRTMPRKFRPERS